MSKKQRKYSPELERLLSVFPSWIKYAQAGVIIFIALIFACLLYFI